MKLSSANSFSLGESEIWEKVINTVISNTTLFQEVPFTFSCTQNKSLKVLETLRLIDWLNGALRRFYQYFSHITATAHIIHAFLGFTSTRLGSEVSCPRTLPRKNQRIQCGSNPGPLDYESNTLPLSHMGPRETVRKMSVENNWEKRKRKLDPSIIFSQSNFYSPTNSMSSVTLYLLSEHAFNSDLTKFNHWRGQSDLSSSGEFKSLW